MFVALISRRGEAPLFSRPCTIDTQDGISLAFYTVRSPPVSAQHRFGRNALRYQRGWGIASTLFVALAPLSRTIVAVCDSSHAPSQFVLSEDDMIDVAGVGYEPVGEFTACGRLVTPHSSPVVASLLEAACLCNNAALGETAAGGGRDIR